MNGLHDYSETELPITHFIDSIDRIIEKGDKHDLRYLLPNADRLRNEIASLQAVFKRLNPDLTEEDFKLYSWHGHATKKKFLDDRGGVLLKVRGLVVWQELMMLS